MKLILPHSELRVHEDVFHFHWSGFGSMNVRVNQCTSVSIRTHGQDSGAQIIFHFRPGDQGAAGRVMVRVDVPSPRTLDAIRFVDALHQQHGLADLATDTPEDEPLRRVPCDSEEWLAFPVSAPSEELYEEIFDRIAAAPAS